MSMNSLRQRITSMNGIKIPDADYLRVPAGEIRAAIAEAAELRRERDEAAEVTKRWRSLALQVDLHRMQAVWHLNALIVSPGHADAAREFLATPPTPGAEIAAKLDGLTAERDELAARLAEIEAQEPVQGPTWLTDEQIEQGRCEVFSVDNPFCPCDAKTMRKAARWAEAAILRAHNLWVAAPAQAAPVQGAVRLAEIERAADLDADLIEAQRAVVQQLASRPACDWPGKCAHKRPAPAAAPVQAEPRFAPCGRSADTSEPTDAELVAAEWPEGFEQAVQRLPTLADAVALIDGPAQAKPCRCRRCLTERDDLLTLASTMIVCPTCGNKRCPHATDHRHACTGSNEPGQTGSWYGGMPERAEPAANELPTRCTECGQLGWHKFGCSHVAHERGLRVTAHSSDSTSCPKGER